MSKSKPVDLEAGLACRLGFLRLGFLRFGFTVGASTIAGGDPGLSGSVRWATELPTSRFSLSLNRDVQPDSDNESRFTTSLAANYTRQMTVYSSLFADFSYFLADGTPSANEVQRADLSLGLNYALTEDWSLNSGVNVRVRDEDNLGRARSNELFLTLSRRIDLY